MTERELRPFGLWESPLSADDAGAGTGLSSPAFDSDGRTLAWLERRGDEAVVVCRRQGEAAPVELTRGHTVRARVFYGGGEFAIARGRVIFVEDGDHLSAVPLRGGGVRRLTPAFGHPAAPAPSPDGRWIAYVHGDGATDRLAVVDAGGANWPRSLVDGADFYMQPAWHPRGRQLAWVEYDLPDMPWDSSRLVVGRLRFPAGAAPVLAERRLVAGGEGQAVCQPEFSPDGRWLAWAGDEGGFSQLWLHDLEDGSTTCLTPDEDGDVALPAWVQGVRVLAFSGDGRRLWFTRSHLGRRSLFVCDLPDGRPHLFEPLADWASVTHVAAAPRGGRIAVVASSPRQPERICSVGGRGAEPRVTVQARSSAERLEAADLSTPRPVRWTADDGAVVHGLHYPPASRRFEWAGPPPLIVDVHGGPTSQADLRYDSEAQYFATRGWAVLLVNYRGSTGYGRAYMTALRGQWGVLDVEDVVAGARHLADEGLADGGRMAVSGGSAGGYSVLRALTLHPGLFAAGACRYGISDLLALADETHKFESRYTDSLLGPLPEAAGLYRERSPLFAADAIQDPVILFQGDEDRVVPRSQSDAIVDSLRRRGVPHEYHVYEGEGHGFRRPESRRHCLRATEAFLRRHVLHRGDGP